MTTALASLFGWKIQNITGLTFAPSLLPFPETLPRPLSALLEILQHTGQLQLFERGVLRDARYVDPSTIMVLGFVVLIVVPIVVDSVVIVSVAVFCRIGAVVPLIVV